VAHPLDGVGEQLQVAVEAEDDGHRAVGALHLLDLGTSGPHPRLDLVALALHALGELGILVGRLAELHVHDEGVAATAVERVAGRVGAPVLHCLEHPGHVATDLSFAAPVAVDDSGDPAHG
jgi:hypothetical protein